MGRKKSSRSQFGRHLVIMAKKPETGRVKTRLGRDIGVVPATNFYRHNLSALLGRFRQERSWHTSLAIAPDGAVFSGAIRSYGFPVIRQGAGDLGKRMQHIFDVMPPGPVIVIGSDIPGIRGDMIAGAFDVLGQEDAVFGPAGDGGYWLVGMKRSPAVIQDIFRNVAWSSETALKNTLDNLADRSVALVGQLDDVDVGADYQRWQTGGARY